MSALVAALIALVKAIPAAASVLEQVAAAYATWKTEQNQRDENEKDARIDAAISRARAGAPKLCDACPFACFGGGQHDGAPPAPSVPSGGPGGS